jgi:predicted ester cyclase
MRGTGKPGGEGRAVESRNVETALSYLDAAFRRDEAAAAALIGPGFTVTNYAQGYTASTVDELIEAARGVAAWSDCEFLVERVIEAMDRTAVVVQGTLTNTHTGGTWCGIPPTGKRVSLSACYILGFDAEGRLVSQDIYEDHFTVFEQLGVVQLVDPPGPRA